METKENDDVYLLKQKKKKLSENVVECSSKQESQKGDSIVKSSSCVKTIIK